MRTRPQFHNKTGSALTYARNHEAHQKCPCTSLLSQRFGHTPLPGARRQECCTGLCSRALGEPLSKSNGQVHAYAHK